MAFIKKTWLARLGTGLNKFTVNGGNKVALDSAPDTITQEGTPLSAQNMNDLEGRIETAFTGVDTALTGIDTDLANLAGNFAQIETTPSTHNYSVGDMLVFNGILYKVTTAIATNDALIVGSNIQAQTVGSAIMNISVLVWENPNKSSSMPAQTIQMDLSPYKAVEILCAEYVAVSSRQTINSCFIPIGNTGDVVCPYFDGTKLRNFSMRRFTVSTTGITMTTGINQSGLDAGNAVPYYVYGIK